MSSKDRLIFNLKGKKGHLVAHSYEDKDLSNVPNNTRYLDLENSFITDIGIKSLPDLPKLVCIDLDSTKITDESLKILSRYLTLQEIWVEDTAITDKGISYLHCLKKLKFISILDCAITDKAVQKLIDAIPNVLVH